MTKPDISVVIPVYNASSTIVKCLKALERQTLRPQEIILVDDGSTDGVASVVERFSSQLEKDSLVFLRQEHGGSSKARNLGAKNAQGTIIAFTDSDCLPPPDWLAKIARALADPKIGAVGGGYCSGVDDTFWQQFSHEELFYRRLKRNSLVSTLVANNMACTKTAFFQAGGFPEKYSVCEDMLLSYNISRDYQVLWLKENCVQHHFKNSLLGFLKHQYVFGRESTRFFIENPRLLLTSHHQGKRLHLAVLDAFVVLVCLLGLIIFSVLNGSISRVFLITLAGFMIGHLIFYLGFMIHLTKRNFSVVNLVRAYVISYLRDLVVSFSSFVGLISVLSKNE